MSAFGLVAFVLISNQESTSAVIVPPDAGNDLFMKTCGYGLGKLEAPGLIPFKVFHLFVEVPKLTVVVATGIKLFC